MVLHHSLQTILSRTGSFPLHFAYSLLKSIAPRDAIIFDPFCGKGTTLLAARMLGHRAYGLDVAPEAVICSNAKLASIDLQSVTRYLTGLRLTPPCKPDVPHAIRTFYRRSTLNQILRIRSVLLNDIESKQKSTKDNATFVLANLLGILHGHASYSLSISSAHAYSMSPEYVRRYALKNGLVPPHRNVVTCLLQKVFRSLKDTAPSVVKGCVKRGSVLNCTRIFPELKGNVDVILTSPPYFNSQTYPKDNWLRLWFLGYDHKALRSDYIETGSVSRYEVLMGNAFRQIAMMLKPGGVLVCVAGDVRHKHTLNGKKSVRTINTAELIARICASSAVGLRIEHMTRHGVRSSSRYFHALHQSNGHGSRPMIERVFIARKP